MKTETKPKPKRPTPRQERFARLVASGEVTQEAAFIDCYPTAEIRFVCNNEGGIRADFSRDSDANEIATNNALAIDRLVRVCMRAQGAHREAIESAVNAAEQSQKEQAQ